MGGDSIGYGEDEIFMGSNVGRVAALGDGLVGIDVLGVWGSIGVDLVWTVILIVTLALRAFETSPDLSTHTHAVSDFYRLDVGPNLDSMADNLMTDADR